MRWNIPSDELVKTLVNAGVPRAIAERDVDLVANSALGPALIRALRQVDRQAELTELLKALSRGAKLLELPRLPGAEEFFAHYWSTNTPFVVRGFIDQWERPFRPTFADLRRRFGDTVVEIAQGRDAYADPGLHFEKTVTSIPLAAFLDIVLEQPGNDAYMVARNATLGIALSKLLDETHPPSELFDEKLKGSGISLWLGPANTRTLLHHDGTNNLFCQVLGRKRVWLVPPFLTHIAESAVGHYATKRPSDPDVLPYAREVVLEPGDAVFLPVGWWHEVESLSPSLSLALVGFNRPNKFSYQPGRTKPKDV